MIEINLLPPEHRPVERTPLPRMLAILAGVFLISSGVAVWAWLVFGAIPNAKAQLKNARQDAELKKKDADVVQENKRKLDALKAREDVLRGLFNQRVCWTRVLDRLAEARSKVTGVVLTKVEMTKTTSRALAAGQPGGENRQLIIKGFAFEATSGDQSKTYLQFIEALCKDQVFAADFEGEPTYVRQRVVDPSTGNAPAPASAAPAAAPAAARGAPKPAEEPVLRPRAVTEFEVVFNFKALKPPAVAGPQPGVAGAPGPGGAH